MLSDLKPFRLIGNVYFVGCVAYSCHLIDTGDGLIMIDNGYENNAPAIVESMAMLGFKPEDVKILLISHEHGDHYWATRGIFGEHLPKIYVNEHARLKMDLKADVLLTDGDHVKLGNTDITCLYTPGHTVDVMSFFFDVEEGGKTYRAGMFGGTGIRQMARKFLEPRGLSMDQQDMFYASIERLRGEKVDVVLGNHCSNNHTVQKAEKLGTCAVNPFIDESGAEWQWLLDTRKRELENLQKAERISDFLKAAGTYYLATVEGDQPRVRPFGTVDVFNNELHIQTGASKAVAAQLRANPKAELCAFKDGTWLRISCELVEDNTLKAQKSMLDAYPELRRMYAEGDGNTLVLKLINVTATFSSFTAAPEVLSWGENKPL